MTVHSLKEGVVIRGTTRAYRRISPCVPRFSVEVFKFLTSVIIKTYLDYGLRILEASWQVLIQVWKNSTFWSEIGPRFRAPVDKTGHFPSSFFPLFTVTGWKEAL